MGESTFSWPCFAQEFYCFKCMYLDRITGVLLMSLIWNSLYSWLFTLHRFLQLMFSWATWAVEIRLTPFDCSWCYISLDDFFLTAVHICPCKNCMYCIVTKLKKKENVWRIVFTVDRDFELFKLIIKRIYDPSERWGNVEEEKNCRKSSKNGLIVN